MADELKDIKENKEGQSADKGQADSKPDERSDRTAERINDLLGKLKDASTSLEEEKKARQALEFERDFGKLSAKYPLLPDVREQVLKSVGSGMPLEDAAIAELHKAGKLQTSDQVNKDKSLNENIGGSADTKGVDKGEKSPSEMTGAEKRAKLVEMEQKGEIRLT